MTFSKTTLALLAFACAAGPLLAQDAAAPAAEPAAATDGAAEASYEITGDATAGERVFRKCQACHVADEAKNRIGPHLVGVVGRDVASVEDFRYSDPLTAKAEEVPVWTPETLSAFLEKPMEYVRGTKMAFTGLRDEDERNDVIAYLAQHGGEG